MRVSEIHVKRIRVNQGLGIHTLLLEILCTNRGINKGEGDNCLPRFWQNRRHRQAAALLLPMKNKNMFGIFLRKFPKQNIIFRFNNFIFVENKNI